MREMTGMERRMIRKEELALNIREESYECGTYLYHNGCEGRELFKIIENIDNNSFSIARVELPSMEIKESHPVNLMSLKNYYHPVKVDINKLHALALRLLDGEEFEIPNSDDNSTSLMNLGDKQTLMTLRSEVERAKEVAEMVRNHAHSIVDGTRKQMMMKIEKLNNTISVMNKQIGRINYVIQTIETYAGIKENIIVLKNGGAADVDVPIVVRQAVLFLDEEMALIDDDFDWQKLSSFDKWLLTDDNFKLLLPDTKSIVAIKPRRKDKRYSVGQTFEDNYYNWVMNQMNHLTMFLIRNGDNLYRLDSEHITLEDRMFPNSEEYKSIIEEEQKRHYDPTDENNESSLFRKRFTKVAFLLQGLMERSEVFSPHNFSGSFIKMDGLDDNIQMHYELDIEKQLSDGKLTYRQWLQNLNAGLSEGKRVLLIKAGYNHSGYEFDIHDYVVDYYNDWNLPGYPNNGVYTLYKSHPKGVDHYYDERHPFLIKFLSEEDTYSWERGFGKRKNRTSIHVSPDSLGILNYDDLKMEDVDYYLNSRLHRSQYIQFVKMLSMAKRIMIKEQLEEMNFIKMLVGQIIKRGLTCKKEYSNEEVARVALNDVKNKLKWKRPVSTREKETYTMVERKLFSKHFLLKYFN